MDSCKTCKTTRHDETSDGTIPPNHFDGECMICYNKAKNSLRFIKEKERHDKLMEQYSNDDYYRD